MPITLRPVPGGAAALLLLLALASPATPMARFPCSTAVCPRPTAPTTRVMASGFGLGHPGPFACGAGASLALAEMGAWVDVASCGVGGSGRVLRHSGLASPRLAHNRWLG